MLTDAQAVEWTRFLIEQHLAEAGELAKIRDYWRGTQDSPMIPSGVPAEVRRMSEMSRINVCSLVVNVPAQSMYVVGFRAGDQPGNDDTWGDWQANKMDAHQTAVHRAAFAYGTAFATVLPGDVGPVIRGHSPRRMVAVYDDADLDWPVYALQVIPGRLQRWRLYDGSFVYELVNDPEKAEQANEAFFPVLEWSYEHRAGRCPVVRFRNMEDLEDEPCSEIVPIMPLQDQMDSTTFDLMVAQHFQAFRQRYIIGWLAPDEETKVKASASRLFTLDAAPDEVKVGEWSQADLKGYLDSRQATLEQFGIVSQVPPHNLLGQMVNLSAEALVAAEVGHSRKMSEREVSFGESWEQVLSLAGAYRGREVPADAQVRWRDTEARSLSQTVDALGKIAQMLEVPVEALWEKIPDVTQQDVESWKALRQSGDAFAALEAELERQAAPAEP